MAELALAFGIVEILPAACKGASIIFKTVRGMYKELFKTEQNNTPGTEAQNKQQEDKVMRETGDEMREISIGTESQIKQQGQMMSEMRDEMREISIASKLSSERISQVFRQVRYLHIFKGTVA